MEIRKFVNNQEFSCSLYVVVAGGVNFIVDPGFYNLEIKHYLQKKLMALVSSYIPMVIMIIF
jgi:hypothetical protein